MFKPVFLNELSVGDTCFDVGKFIKECVRHEMIVKSKEDRFVQVWDVPFSRMYFLSGQTMVFVGE